MANNGQNMTVEIKPRVTVSSVYTKHTSPMQHARLFTLSRWCRYSPSRVHQAADKTQDDKRCRRCPDQPQTPTAAAALVDTVHIDECQTTRLRANFGYNIRFLVYNVLLIFSYLSAYDLRTKRRVLVLFSARRAEVVRDSIASSTLKRCASRRR